MDLKLLHRLDLAPSPAGGHEEDAGLVIVSNHTAGPPTPAEPDLHLTLDDALLHIHPSGRPILKLALDIDALSHVWDRQSGNQLRVAAETRRLLAALRPFVSNLRARGTTSPASSGMAASIVPTVIVCAPEPIAVWLAELVELTAGGETLSTHAVALPHALAAWAIADHPLPTVTWIVHACQHFLHLAVVEHRGARGWKIQAATARLEPRLDDAAPQMGRALRAMIPALDGARVPRLVSVRGAAAGDAGLVGMLVGLTPNVQRGRHDLALTVGQAWASRDLRSQRLHTHIRGRAVGAGSNRSATATSRPGRRSAPRASHPLALRHSWSRGVSTQTVTFHAKGPQASPEPAAPDTAGPMVRSPLGMFVGGLAWASSLGALWLTDHRAVWMWNLFILYEALEQLGQGEAMRWYTVVGVVGTLLAAGQLAPELDLRLVLALGSLGLALGAAGLAQVRCSTPTGLFTAWTGRSSQR